MSCLTTGRWPVPIGRVSLEAVAYDEYQWFGPKRGGKFRHVRPTGQRIDNYCGWICRQCWQWDVLVKEPRNRPHVCRSPRCLKQPLTRLLPLLEELQISREVAEAVLRVGGGSAFGDLVLERERELAQARG